MKIFQKISYLVREEEEISLELHCLGCSLRTFDIRPGAHGTRFSSRSWWTGNLRAHDESTESRFHVGRKRRKARLDKKTKRATMFLSLRRRVTPVFFIRSAFLNRGNQKGNPILRQIRVCAGIQRGRQHGKSHSEEKRPLENTNSLQNASELIEIQIGCLSDFYSGQCMHNRT